MRAVPEAMAEKLMATAGEFVASWDDVRIDDIAAQLGQIVVYLVDQIQRGRVPRGARVLEAGCGAGRAGTARSRGRGRRARRAPRRAPRRTG